MTTGRLPSVEGGIQPTIVDAKGDLIVATAADTVSRIAVGSNDQVLTADSSTSTGVKWATPASGGGMTLIQETVANADTSISFSSIPGTYKQLMLVWHGVRHSTSGSQFGLRINNLSTANYYSSGFGGGAGGTIGADATSGGTQVTLAAGGVDSYVFGNQTNTTDNSRDAKGILIIDNYASTSKYKTGWASYSYRVNTVPGIQAYSHNFTFDSTSAVTSLDIFRVSGSATISNGTDTSIRLYGIS